MKVSVMLTVNCVAFTVMLLPYYISIHMIAFGVFRSEDPYFLGVVKLVNSLAVSLKMMNHSINFVLYSLSGRAFRKELVAMVHQVCCVICNRNTP